MPAPDRVPRFARPLVLSLIVAMCAAAVFVWEPWPLTSFRLFSHLRTDEQRAWQATAVRSNGDEVPFSIDSLELGFRNFGFRMQEFVDADEKRRAELCRTWMAAAQETVGPSVIQVRIYERRWLLSSRNEDRALEGSEELMFTCTTQGVRGGG